VNELELEVAPEFRWQAGQYVTLHPPNAAAYKDGPLAYSIASACTFDSRPKLTLAIGEGSGTLALATALPGSTLDFEGPFGSFTLPEAPAALLIGAGTGVAPLRAQAQEWLARPTASSIVLLVGARYEDDLLWHSELAALAQRTPALRYEPVLSRPSASWRRRSGRVQSHLYEIASSLPPRFVARVCGVGDMVEACLATLRTLGVPADDVSAESY
jgi:CDP-4-dehydro-6-deoxyglucose reductase